MISGEGIDAIVNRSSSSSSSSGGVSSNNNSEVRPGSEHASVLEEPKSVTNAPHQLGPSEVPYKIVIPTLERWKAACVVNPHERGLQRNEKAFILEKTLSFLGRHDIPAGVVWLFVASHEEEKKYREVLQGSGWDDVNIVIGVRGILAQRNFIVKYFPEGEYLMSIDDDVSDLLWKHIPGISQGALKSLPNGALKPLIFDAYARMKTYNAYICGLSSTVSRNVMSMHCDGISTRNGEVNGFLYFFINRHDEELLPSIADATEDAERSLRYFRKDGRVLRYRMYCGVTRVWANYGGLQSLYGEASEGLKATNARRKQVERDATQKIHEMFPEVAGAPKTKKDVKTLGINFLLKGGAVIPSTTSEALAKHSSLEKEAMAARKAAKPPQPLPVESSVESATQDYSSIQSFESTDVGASLDIVNCDEEDCSRGGMPAMDEDEQFFESLRRSKEDHAKRGTPVLEKDLMVEAVLLSINGNFADPMGEACKASELSYKEELARSEQEDRECKFALELSLSSASEAASMLQLGSSSSSVAAPKRARALSEAEPASKKIHVERLSDFSSFCGMLQTMGFERDAQSLQQVYDDSSGDIAHAVAIMLSHAQQ